MANRLCGQTQVHDSLLDSEKWQSDRKYENTEVLKPGKKRRPRTIM